MELDLAVDIGTILDNFIGGRFGFSAEFGSWFELQMQRNAAHRLGSGNWIILKMEYAINEASKLLTDNDT